MDQDLAQVHVATLADAEQLRLTDSAESYQVKRTRPRNAHFLLLSICDELCL